MRLAQSQAARARHGPTPLPIVRQTVRDLLLASPAFFDLSHSEQREMAALMVRVCDTAARLIQEEAESEAEIGTLLQDESREPASSEPLVQAQAAGDEFSGVAAQRIAGTTRSILNAVSFPGFVGDLINGVFKAMTNSNLSQMQSYIDLLNNVAASTEGFAGLNYAPARARQWLVEQFPSIYQLEGEDDDFDNGFGDDSSDNFGGSNFGDFGGIDDGRERRVILRSNVQKPSDETLRAALGLPDDATIPSGDPDATLVPLVRQKLARTRQETLATLVRLGMQRIVIDGGRINASMRFHIDTRSAAQADSGSTFDFRNTMSGSGRFGLGPWGASASMRNTIGYVSTSQTQTTEEMNTDLDLNSSVEIIFRTDQVPLNRMADATQATKILAKSRNPAEEQRLYNQEQGQRRSASRQTEATRRTALRRNLHAPRESTVPAGSGQERPNPAGSGQGRSNAAQQNTNNQNQNQVSENQRPGGAAAGNPSASPSPANNAGSAQLVSQGNTPAT